MSLDSTLTQRIRSPSVSLNEGISASTSTSQNSSKLDTPLLHSTSSSSGTKMPASANASSGNQLGTFIGVYVPCVLAFFGVILFERVGFVVGQAGLFSGFLIIFLAFSSVVFTALSLSAIVTNGKVASGGAYFIISRTIGPEFGGSIGLVYSLGNVINSAISFIGAAEALSVTFPIFPSGRWWNVLYATIFLIIFTIIAYSGADAFAKAALIIFLSLWVAILFGAIALLFQKPGFTEGYTGISSDTLRANWGPGYTKDSDTGKEFTFQQVFSIFYGSVAGVAAGANLSGDLADPSRAIPIGTLAAVATSCLVYTCFSFLLAASVERKTLHNNYFIIQSAAWSPYVVAQGVFAATLSTGLSGLIGGSRIIQALARDNLFPFLRFFAHGTEDKDEPRRAVILCAILTEAFILIGNLNVIAPLVSFSFLITYLMINLCSFLSEISGTPNWRPSFKHSNSLYSGLGALLCFVFMLVISWEYAILSIALLGVCWGYVHYKSPVTDWGDISQALIYHQVRKYLLRLDTQKVSHVKLWRPSILLYIDQNPRKQLKLIHFANNIKKGGLFVVGTAITGHVKTQAKDMTTANNFWRHFLNESTIKAFSEVVICSDKRQGIANLVNISGVGAMKANTLMLDLYVPPFFN